MTRGYCSGGRLPEALLDDVVRRTAARHLTGDRGKKDLSTEGEQRDIRSGSNRGGPRHIPEEGDLPEFGA